MFCTNMSCNSFKKNLESPGMTSKCLKSPRNAVEPISPLPLTACTAPSNSIASTDLNSPTRKDSYSNDGVPLGTTVQTSTKIGEALNKGSSTDKPAELMETKPSLDNPQSPMNVLATVALAISPTFVSHHATFNSSDGLSKKPYSTSFEQSNSDRNRGSKFDVDGRPFKRARSEVLYPSQSQSGVIRPSSTHDLFEDRMEHSFRLSNVKRRTRRGSDIRSTRSLSSEVASGKQILEAELLLGFSRGGSVPSPAKSGSEMMSQSRIVNEQTLSAQEEYHMHQARALPISGGRPGSKGDNLSPLRTDEVDRPIMKSNNSTHQFLYTGDNGKLARNMAKTKSIGLLSEDANSQDPTIKLENALGKRKIRPKHGSKPIRKIGLRKMQMPQINSIFAKEIEPTGVMQWLSQPNDISEISSDPLRRRLDTSVLCDLRSRIQIQDARRQRVGSAPINACHYSMSLVKARAKSAPARDFESFERTKLPASVIRRVAKRTSKRATVTTACSGCKLSSRSTSYEDDKWICCNGCKGWYHYRCAGFNSEREVRSVHKFYCKGCESKYGSSTFVRKSGRAHTAVDYAGLNEGVLRTSDESPEHHYIQSIKDGIFKFDPDKFARIRPELITANFFEKCGGITEPIIIPVAWNPHTLYSDKKTPYDDIESMGWPLDGDFEFEVVADDGQDNLDMVVPHQLTVRQVADLYGAEEKVEVIDVKSQEGEDKRWNMRKWVDYYEEDGEKVIRNVISLEVSASKMGRLIRRPQLVRELDLQDDVWPEEEVLNGFYPKVQFYCLMSVADCYTDFHIDFGGSSVYYHILKGKKTFLFIPPTKQNLKKYEDWCLSETQNWTFLPKLTKECYRVDLSAGDTMMIPSGWIHAVWTPENSLVIGGNFLTRLHYEMQIRIAEIEKNTKVPRKFRYPHFQKIMWYTAIRYLKKDPLPLEIQNNLCQGGVYPRTRPIYEEWDNFGHNSDNGTDKYNSRYYSRPELDGLPELARYLFRTVMISRGTVEGISAEVKTAVTKSIPKSQGEPFDLVRSFAMWVAWKRGNEAIPQWARPGSEKSVNANVKNGKKLSVAALRRLENQENESSIRKNPKRLTARSTSKAAKSASSEILTDEKSALMQNGGSGPQYLSTEQIEPSADTFTTMLCGTSISKYTICDHIDTSKNPKIKQKVRDDNLSNPISTQIFLAESQRLQRKTSDDRQKLPLSQQLHSTSYKSSIENAPPDTSSLINPPIAQRDPESLNEGLSFDDVYANVVSIQEFSPTSKRGRGKACSDCRRSKRRCVHGEIDTASCVDLHSSCPSNREYVRKYENLRKNGFNSSTTEVVQRKGTEQGSPSNSSITQRKRAYQGLSAENSTTTRSKDSTMAMESSNYRGEVNASMNSGIKRLSSLSTCTAIVQSKDRTPPAKGYQKSHMYNSNIESSVLFDNKLANGRIAIKSEILSPRSEMHENPAIIRSSIQNGDHTNDSVLMSSRCRWSDEKEPDIPAFQQKEKNVSNSKSDVAMCGAIEPSEDDSLRLVRLLATSEFGLRRRN